MEWWRVAMIVVGGVLLILTVVYEQAQKSGMSLLGFIRRSRSAAPVAKDPEPELPPLEVPPASGRLNTPQALKLISDLSSALVEFDVEPERRQAMLQPIMNVLLFSSGVKK